MRLLELCWERKRVPQERPGTAQPPTGGCQGTGTLGQDLKQFEPCSGQTHGRVLGWWRMSMDFSQGVFGFCLFF